MSILFKCKSCKRACVAAEAGTEVVCTCGVGNVAPLESEQDCVFVYKDGYPNEGMPITLVELGQQIAAGQYGPLDLAFYNGIWQPLNMIFEMAPIKEVPSSSSQSEIALRHKELPPVPGFSGKGGNGRSIIADRLEDARHWFLRVTRFRYKTPLQKCIYLLVVLLLAGLLYACLIGKLVNRILWRPAYVTVYNNSNLKCTAQLGGVTQSIEPYALCTFQDIFVAYPTSGSLKVMPISGNGETMVLSVPLRPALDVVVPYGKRGALGEYTMEKSGSLSLGEAHLSALAGEIAGDRFPESVESIQRELQKMGETLFVRDIDDKILTSSNYDLSKIGIVRSMDDASHARGAVKAGLPQIYRNHGIVLNFKNASFSYEGRDYRRPCTFTLPIKERIVPVNISLYARNYRDKITISEIQPVPCKATVAYDSNGNLTLSLAGLDGNVNYFLEEISKKMEFKGKWSYSAVRCAKGKNAGRWMSTWKFSGSAVKHARNRAARTLTVTFIKNYDGSNSFTVK